METNSISQTTNNQGQSIQPTFTSSGQDYSRSGYWNYSLEIESRAERSDKLLPLMLSGAELVLDALQNHKNDLMKEYSELLEAWVNDKDATLESIKEALDKGEFVSKLHEIKTLGDYIDNIAAGLAADLREIGNSIREKEVSHE